MDDETIIKEVLLKLDNWIAEDIGGNPNNYEDLDFNKKVSKDEILHFYDVATNYAQSYTQLNDTSKILIIKTALILWTAGLLWKKYDIRPNDQIDETYPVGYGDSLIIQAKEMLKPYKNYNFMIF